ncbi:hypothetical protein FOPG_19608 [Fusarium oxysporum f. sp. conglutinans race 2 54008]|uniref:Uncharacterized protein n=1 Tax=Fusarium oxysporum f. sp. conglutinans race 2 54008 TaxID=1089457 RepID=X0GKE7_FUSOX|nr:hypothetical protein FOPG_19608 [Fusarium oxysporum f. sp. conglutinans race 2 54008]
MGTATKEKSDELEQKNKARSTRARRDQSKN